jgi:hypothetical protein
MWVDHGLNAEKALLALLVAEFLCLLPMHPHILMFLQFKGSLMEV